MHEDFKNQELLSKPRGSVYQTEEHGDLLCENKCACG